MTILLSPATNDKAVALVNAHLADRAAKLIVSRKNASGTDTFLVKSSDGSEQYVVTLAGVGANVTTCSCKGFAHRHTCKHTAAVELLTAPSQAAPVTPRKVRREREEEI